MTAHRKDNRKRTLEQIAAEHLGIETLETRHRDGLDFHDLPVWAIAEALQAAYEAGRSRSRFRMVKR